MQQAPDQIEYSGHHRDQKNDNHGKNHTDPGHMFLGPHQRVLLNLFRHQPESDMQDKGYDDQIIQVAYKGNKIGNQVDRADQIYKRQQSDPFCVKRRSPVINGKIQDQ
jgi:hypothetical protein